jgi:hypothetical protein
VLTRPTMPALTLERAFPLRHAPMLTCGPMAHVSLSVYSEHHHVTVCPTDCSALAPHAHTHINVVFACAAAFKFLEKLADG